MGVVTSPLKPHRRGESPMNVSSRWCVTAVVAFGSLACSDPVPPPAQGAFIASVNSVSPAPAGKACPAGAAFTYDVPAVRNTTPAEMLDENTYLHKTIDGEGGSRVSCSVKSGGGGFTFSGKIELGGKALEISQGTLGGDNMGSARAFIVDTEHLSGALVSPTANCTVNASDVQAGSIWATFRCTSVESPPSSYCRAEGTFVFENCAQ
jgi:hypothetical protein